MAPGRMVGRQGRGLLGARRLLPRRLGRDDIELATGSFNSLGRPLGRIVDLESNLLGSEAARADQADAVAGTTNDTGSDQRLGVDHALGVELARVDVGLDAINTDFIEVLRVRHIEAALRHAHVERHLAALEAVDGNAGASRLALAAATTGLADARADTTADTDAGLVGTGIVAKFVQTGHLRTFLTRRRRGRGAGSC